MLHGIGLTLPQGYATPAGEAGKRLSGGEKQRIAIARMLLKNAPIVILDEATAFADPENEDTIQQSIAALTKGKTLLVIAHRLATIEQADQILVVDDGRIVEKAPTPSSSPSPAATSSSFASAKRRKGGNCKVALLAKARIGVFLLNDIYGFISWQKMKERQSL